MLGYKEFLCTSNTQVHYSMTYALQGSGIKFRTKTTNVGRVVSDQAPTQNGEKKEQQIQYQIFVKGKDLEIAEAIRSRLGL